MALSKIDTTASAVVTLMPAAGSKEISAKIDAANVSRVIERMTQLYNNPIHATVREVISNATDASAKVKDTLRKPVEVVTPSLMQRSFIVRDHGVGMSTHDVESIFANYGATTKSGDIESIGSYGLGGKAPLAYTSAFEVTTTKDGVTTTFSMSRSNGETITTIRSVEETSLPSGTEVRVPVNQIDIEAFVDAVAYYRDHSYARPITVNDELYHGNEDYYSSGEVSIFRDHDGDVYGEVYVRRDFIGSFIKAASQNGISFTEIAYSLHGWLYSARGDSSKIKDPNIIVEIVPALVNFGSSRDAITVDEKLSALNELMRVNLKKDAFLESAFAAFRSLDRKMLRSASENLKGSVRITTDEKSFLVGSYSGSIELLESDFGFNPFLLSSLSFNTSVTIALSSPYHNSSVPRKMSVRTGDRTKSPNVDRKVENLERVGEILSLFIRPELEGALSITRVAAAVSPGSKVLVITETTDALFKAVIRHREAVFSEARRGFTFIFSHVPAKAIDKKDLALAKLVLGEESIQLTSATEFLELVKPEIDRIKTSRLSERTRKFSTSVLTDSRYFSKPLYDQEDDIAKIRRGGKTRSSHSSFAAAFASEGTVLIVCKNDDWRNAYTGMINAGIELKNVPVVIYDRKLNADEAKELMVHQDKIFFTPSAPLMTAQAKKLAQGRVYSATTLDSTLAAMTFENLIAGAVGYTSTGLNYKLISLLPDLLDQSNEALVKTLRAFSVKAKNMTEIGPTQAMEQLESRFGQEYVEAFNKITKTVREIQFDKSSIEAELVTFALGLGKRDEELKLTPLVAEIMKLVVARIEKEETLNQNETQEG